MSTIAQILKDNRLQRDLKLTDVSTSLKIDNALVSKIERGDRFATKIQIDAFIEFYNLDKRVCDDTCYSIELRVVLPDFVWKNDFLAIVVLIF